MNTTQFKLDTIEANIKARHEEIAGYEINIFNYEHMIASGNITEHQYLDQIQNGIDGNKSELRKVQLVLAALEAQKAYLTAL